jgi:cobyrinic acid a,c-diamide synthase
MDRAADLIRKFIDVETLLARSHVAVPFTHQSPFNYNNFKESPDQTRIRIAIARDEAFCFYYEDNIDLLKAYGADICFFSPVRGEPIPTDIDAVILGGGYPEMHLEKLSSNKIFFDELRRRFSLGIPIYAECGGLMTLSRFIEDWEGKRWTMAGILPFGTKMLKRRKALGYVEVKLSRNCILGPAGSRIRGHEFHYSEICNEDFANAPPINHHKEGLLARQGGFIGRAAPKSNVSITASMETIYEVSRRKGDTIRQEGYCIGSAIASYVHQHWGSNPNVPKNFVSFLKRRIKNSP